MHLCCLCIPKKPKSVIYKSSFNQSMLPKSNTQSTFYQKPIAGGTSPVAAPHFLLGFFISCSMSRAVVTNSKIMSAPLLINDTP
jgi:hypothetical protein